MNRCAIAQIRPTPAATPDQISRHCASIAIAAADGRTVEALGLLQDAHDAGFASPLLALVDAALLPATTEYIEHVSDDAPVPAGTLVCVDLGDGQPLVELAGMLAWGSYHAGPAGEGRIQRWARVATPHA